MAELVLGIDPGSRATGYGLVMRNGQRLSAVAHGVIRPKAKAPLADRLETIFSGLVEQIERHGPVAAAVEEVFFSANARSALTLGQARGVALLAAAVKGLPVFEYTPSVVKNAVVGYGRAEKRQVQHMVRLILGLPGAPAQDAADALAVAICHCNSMDFQDRAGR